jgi:HD-GYP domain-containing protein (c-di-GMP phosphodiesterase class II)
MYSRLSAREDVRLLVRTSAKKLEAAMRMRDAGEVAFIVDSVIAALKAQMPSEGVLPHIVELVAQPLQDADTELLSQLLVTLAQPFARLHRGDASQGLWALMALRDPHVGAHTNAVASIARRLGGSLELDAGQRDRLVRSSRIFDIGKLLVPSELLHGAFELSNETWPLVKRHAEAGADVVKNITQLWTLSEIVRSHHERFDGYGYPDNLKGHMIPIEARIIAVADAWHAALSPRAYRHPSTVPQAMQMFKDGRGSQWDPAMVDAMLVLV